MSFEIFFTDDVATTGVKSLCYGESGAGKTKMIETLPAPFIFSTEAGLLSLSRSRLPYVEVDSYKMLIEATNWMVGSAEAAQYASFAFDSMSDVAEVILTEEKSKTKDGRRAYGETADTMLSFCRYLQRLDKDVYMTAKEGPLVDASGVAKFGPMFPGKNLAAQIPFHFDEVFQLVVVVDATSGAQARWLRTAGDQMYVAKDRSGALDAWEPADLTAVYSKIKGAA